MTFAQEQQLMMPTFYYVDTREMAPRPGQKFSTIYYRQTQQQRLELSEWLTAQIKHLAELMEQDHELDFESQQPLPGFPKTGKQPNRSMQEILTDMLGEIQGTKTNGKPKDFAAAPIQRWNKLFAGSELEFRLEESTSTNRANQYHNLFKD